ncbi:TPA: paerucumarin biosynthesis oxygenase PvcB, partial [Pseudomonas aeruginosa]
LELVEQEGAEDHIFANNYVPLHWDGMYLETVPEFQVFHCVDAPGDSDGGRTTFSSTPAALQLADSSELELWRRASGRYQRSAAHYSSRSAAPIVERHPRREFPILRFCEPPVEGDASFINPSEFHYDGIAPEQRGELLDSLRRCLYHPQAHYAHRWRSDDLVIADNLTLLHGREAFAHRAPRHLR